MSGSCQKRTPHWSGPHQTPLATRATHDPVTTQKRNRYHGDYQMNAHNRGVTARLIEEIDRFTSGGELGEMQSQLQAALTLLERDGSTVREAVRLAEADVEEIQFIVLLDEQRPAAVFRLDQLREALTTELDVA